jgi:large subunit ribosomal protein L6
MSKIGRKPIPLKTAKIEIHNNTVKISGGKVDFVHELPVELTAKVLDKALCLESEKKTRAAGVLWGLHRALLANKVKGVEVGFEQKIIIVGLGYKAQLTGKKMLLTLGYTHKIDYELPSEVTVDIDKTGQVLLFKSPDKFLLGKVCDTVRSFRPPEPYKGTGIMKEHEKIIRKAGKTKASAG